MMNMDKLFLMLPRDLQWEVLTKFVGSHAVRKGKLMRKLILNAKYQIVMKMSRIQQVANPYNLDCVHTTAFVILSNERKISCSQNADRGSEVQYMYINTRPNSFTGFFDCGVVYKKVVPPENLVALPPFEKHSYPSYEYTDKKKKATQTR
jgi:hypothetical protein